MAKLFNIYEGEQSKHRHEYIFDYLQSILKVSKISSSLAVWSSCAILSALMMKDDGSVNFRLFKGKSKQLNF